MTTLVFTVPGHPAPQGSRRYLGQRGGKGITVESSARVKPWRADVRAAAEKEMAGWDYAALWDAPLFVRLTFRLPRPRSHYRTGRNAHLLRDSAPQRPTGKPDIDKLTRAILDALTGLVWADDSHIATLNAIKQYGAPGCDIHITALETAP